VTFRLAVVAGVLATWVSAAHAESEPDYVDVRPSTRALSPAELEAFAAAPMAQFVGEQSVYEVEILGGVALQVTLEIDEPVALDGGDDDGLVVVPVRVEGRSMGFFDTVYPLHDTGLTYLDPTTLRPVFTEKRFDERGRTSRVVLDYREPGPVVAVRRDGDEVEADDRIEDAPIPDAAWDEIGMLFDLRTQPMRADDAYVYTYHDGVEPWCTRAEVLGPDVWYANGGLVDVIAVEFHDQALVSERGLPWSPDRLLPPVLIPESRVAHTATVLFSDDATRSPLGADIEAWIGDLRVRRVAWRSGPVAR
jgi:hypothetical protein